MKGIFKIFSWGLLLIAFLSSGAFLFVTTNSSLLANKAKTEFLQYINPEILVITFIVIILWIGSAIKSNTD